MNKFYTITITASILFLFNSCSKDILKPYEERIIGTWQLDDVNRVGIGGDTDGLPFKDGTFTFSSNGQLNYTSQNGTNYSGSWDIQRDYYDDRSVRTLQITAVNFTTQEIRSEYFEEINFTGTNKFKAYIRSGFHTYVFHFEK